MAKTLHGTLTANALRTVVVEPGEEGIVVVNRSLSGALWVRTDGVDPGVGAAGSFVVLGSRFFQMSRTAVQLGPVTVKLISDAALSFSVEAVN